MKYNILNNNVNTASEMAAELMQAFSDVDIPDNLASGLLSAGSMTTESVSTISSIDDTLAPTLRDMITSMHDEYTTESSRRISVSSHDVDMAIQAGVLGAVLAANPMEQLRNEISTPSSTDSLHVVENEAVTALTKRELGRECFSHKAGGDFQEHSCLFNLRAAIPDDFPRVVAPGILFSPSESGLRQTVEILYVQDDALHSLSGDIMQYNRRSLVAAMKDSSILGDGKRRAVPIVRTGANSSVNKFIPTAEIAWTSRELDGTMHDTGVLKTGVDIDIIGISQTDAQVAQGPAGISDALTSEGGIAALYARLDAGKYLRFNTLGRESASFRKSQVGKSSSMTLTFDSIYTLDETSVYTNGNPIIADIPALDSANNANGDKYTVYVRVSATGDADVADGTLNVVGSRFEVVRIIDLNGNAIDLTAGEGLDIKNAIMGTDTGDAKCRIAGFDPDVSLANLNHKRRGKLIGAVQYSELCVVPLLEPISCPREVGAVRDPEEINTLVKTIKMLINNAAVTFLNETEDVIDTWKATAMPDLMPDTLGLMRYLVTPTNYTATVDVANEVIGLSSSDRFADISAVIVNAVRNAIYSMWTESNMSGVRRMLGRDEKPTIGVAIHEDLEQYLFTMGDDRLFGDKFNIRIVTTINDDFKDTIAVFPSTPIRNNQPDCTNYGHMGYSTEAVVNLDLTVNGGFENVLSVYPRFKFCLTNPVRGTIKVSNIIEAFSPTGG